MKHLFEVGIALRYGINAAILLEHLGYWIKKNEANGVNFYDGTFWTYNSRRALRELFPYMSERQINTALEKLIEDGLVITGNYNKSTYDRTLWYALTQKGKCILHFELMEDDKKENGNCQNVRPIPINNTSNNTIINTDIKNNKKTENPLFEQFWKAYPKCDRKVDKKGCRKIFEKINPSDELFATMLKALEQHKKSAQWNESNGKYIPQPKTWLNQERWETELQEAKGHSFDVDDFFQAALKRSYKNL